MIEFNPQKWKRELIQVYPLIPTCAALLPTMYTHKIIFSKMWNF